MAILFSLLPAVLFFLGIKTGNEGTVQYPLSKFIAYMGAGTLCVTLILSSRFRFIDSLFLGVDKAYFIHHLFGIFAYGFMVVHLIMVIFRSEPLSLDLVFFSSTQAIFGSIAFFLVTMLLFLTLFIRIPYARWLLSHKLMGIVAILSYLHILVFGSGNYASAHGIVISLYFFIAVSGYFYKLLFYRYLGPRIPGRVSGIEKHGDISEIFIEPETVPEYLPGQFFYISFNSPKISSESHPFSISSSNGKNIRFSIKMKGDFVSTIDADLIGSDVDLYGPYGGFSRHSMNGERDMIWIAGGIGITPFLSLLQYESEHPSSRNITLVWSVAAKGDAVYDDEVRDMASRVNNLNYTLWISGKEGHVSGKDLKELGGDMHDSLVMICAPMKMVYSISSQLMDMGVSHKNIIYEFFNYRD